MDETKKHRQDPVPMKMGRNRKKIRFPEQIKNAHRSDPVWKRYSYNEEFDPGSG